MLTNLQTLALGACCKDHCNSFVLNDEGLDALACSPMLRSLDANVMLHKPVGQPEQTKQQQQRAAPVYATKLDGIAYCSPSMLVNGRRSCRGACGGGWDCKGGPTS